MALLNQLQRASFKGAEFLIKTSSVAVGRKTAVHEYPNSDRRFVEDLGLAPKVFTITGIIGDPRYFQKRDALIAALESKGTGTLVHPFYGQQTVAATQHTVSENDTILGECQFSMTFEVSDDNLLPSATSDNIFLMEKTKTTGLTETNQYFEDNYSMENSFLNIGDASDKMDSMGNLFSDNSDLLTDITDDFETFTNELIEFQESVSTFLNQPAELAAAINNLFVVGEGITSDPLGQFNFWEGLFGFGSTDNEIIPSTTAREEKQKNRNTINDVINVNALLEAYNSTTDITFNNEDQLNNIKDILENQFQSLDFDRLSEDVGLALKQMRVESRKNFDNIAIGIAKIEVVNIPVFTPAKIISYQYYGDVDMEQDLIELNSINSSAFVSGDIKVLTDVTN